MPSDASDPPPLSRLFWHWIERIEADRKQSDDVRQAYTEHLARKAEILAGSLVYRAKEGAWRPTDKARIYTACETDLRRLGAADELAVLAEIRKDKLDETLPAIGGLEQAELESLAYEYSRIREPIPDAVRERLTEVVYLDALHEVGAKLKEYEGAGPDGLQKLYEEEIPRIIADALSVGEDQLTDQRRTELEEARDYLNRLKRTKSLEFHFEALHQHGDKGFKPAVRISVKPPNGPSPRAARYYYPINGEDTNQVQNLGGWPAADKAEKKTYSFEDQGGVVKLSWHYGDVVKIDIWDLYGLNEHLVAWNSEVIRWRDEYADGSYELPGLSFVVFWAAHAQYTPSIDRERCGYRLALKKEGNGYDLLHVPEFLREANKRRYAQ